MTARSIGELARHEADRQALEAMLDQASTDELVDFIVDDPQMAEFLRRMGAAHSKNSASSPSGQKPAHDNI